MRIRQCVSLIFDAPSYPIDTLNRYDGRALRPNPADGFSESDILAARVIERRALREEVGKRILAADLPWNATPPSSVDIEDLTPGSVAYEQLSDFYSELTSILGVGPAIASKLMYLKWPAATPITDGLIRDLYEESAKQCYRNLLDEGQLPSILRRMGWTRLYTLAIRDDVLANRESGALDSLRGRIRDSGHAAVLAEVSDTRLLDIVAWSYMKERKQLGRGN